MKAFVLKGKNLIKKVLHQQNQNCLQYLKLVLTYFLISLKVSWENEFVLSGEKQ